MSTVGIKKQETPRSFFRSAYDNGIAALSCKLSLTFFIVSFIILIMRELITELTELSELLKNAGTIPESASRASVRELIDDIDSIISSLARNDFEALDRVAFLFSANCDAQKIAAEIGREDEYLKIARRTDELVGKLRCMKKNDPAFFGNVKDGKYTDSSTYASCPGRLKLSANKWKDIKRFYKLGPLKSLKLDRKKTMVRECISHGDTQPAMVMSVNPLLIASYSDEMDAVVLLGFPCGFAEKNNLKQYDRLITVNTYVRMSPAFGYVRLKSDDVFYGKNYLGRWQNVNPIVGEFVSSETDKIEKHKKAIPESLWRYVKALGEEYLNEHKELARKGFWFL